ncbi:unnamed protein product [Parajaminaea phylloscopi]
MGVGDAQASFRYTRYSGELELPLIAALIEKELSEPYLIYTYRYFLNQWPQLCWLAWNGNGEKDDTKSSSSVPSSLEPVGVVLCKLDRHLKGERNMRGYIAMLSVHPDSRGRGVASQLVKLAIASMIPMGAGEVVLETEIDNKASLALYERLGFMREKRLHSFYLNGKDCFRLVLPLPDEVKQCIQATIPLPPQEPHESSGVREDEVEPRVVVVP